MPVLVPTSEQWPQDSSVGISQAAVYAIKLADGSIGFTTVQAESNASFVQKVGGELEVVWTTTPGVGNDSYLFLEDGTSLLLEDGTPLMLEDAWTAIPEVRNDSYLLLEDGTSLLLEDGTLLMLEDGVVTRATTAVSMILLAGIRFTSLV